MFREIYDLKKKILVIFGSPLISAVQNRGLLRSNNTVNITLLIDGCDWNFFSHCEVVCIHHLPPCFLVC